MGTYTKSEGGGETETNQRAGGPGKITFDSALGLSYRTGGQGFFLGFYMYKHAFEGLSEQVLH